MGVAEAIPGVSGGTIAFITGIYEELLSTIKSFTPTNIKLAFSNPKAFWVSINGPFLVMLFLGMAFGLSIGVIVISSLLETHKPLLWAVFFGIVVASVIFMGRDVKWNAKAIALGVLFALVSYGLTLLNPAQGSNQLLYVFMAGCIAISALMLPGISGSFMLLLLGLYDAIIHAVKNMITTLSFGEDFWMILVFSLGLIVGLFSFARVLSFLFRDYHNLTMASMIGVLLGSLNKLWPYKEINTAFDKETGLIESVHQVRLTDPDRYKVVTESNLTPGEYAMFESPQTLIVILLATAGFVLVWWMMRHDPIKE